MGGAKYAQFRTIDADQHRVLPGSASAADGVSSKAQLEAALYRTATEYVRYSSTRRKQGYIYGGLELPTSHFPLPTSHFPLPDFSLDAVLITSTPCTIPDAIAALLEMRRVLAPAGKRLFCEHRRAPEASVQRW